MLRLILYTKPLATDPWCIGWMVLSFKTRPTWWQQLRWLTRLQHPGYDSTTSLLIVWYIGLEWIAYQALPEVFVISLYVEYSASDDKASHKGSRYFDGPWEDAILTHQAWRHTCRKGGPVVSPPLVFFPPTEWRILVFLVKIFFNDEIFCLPDWQISSRDL